MPCDLSTDYGGDELCILPPEPGDAMQIHLGPSDCDDLDAVAPFMVAPAVENVECPYQTLNNDARCFYDQYYRMRKPAKRRTRVRRAAQA